MEKIVLLPQDYRGVSKRATRNATIIAGICNIGLGIFHTIEHGLYPFGIIWIVLGVSFIWSTFIVVSPKSFWALKGIITDEYLSVRTRLFRRPPRFSWSDIRKIELKSYEINLMMKSGQFQTITYKTNTESSLALKQAIREVAEKNDVEVLP